MKKKGPVEKHFDKIAEDYDKYTQKRNLHYSTLKDLLKYLIPPKKSVFEIGCGTGDLLASVNPSKGFGMDISGKMIEIAKVKYKDRGSLVFSKTWPTPRFDYIFMSDVIEHLEEPEETFRRVARLMGRKTVFICTMMNPVWIPIETIYNLLGWKMPEGPFRRIRYEDIKKMLNNAGLKIKTHDYKLLIPVKVPIITKIMNKYLEHPFRKFAFIEYFTATKL